MTTAYTSADHQRDHWALKGICNDSEEEFHAKVVSAIAAVAEREGYGENPLGREPVLNLFGYGTVREVLSGPDNGGYFWGHEAAEALGWDPAEFAQWAEGEWKWDLVQQRYADEESGTLGWDLIRHHPVHVSVWQGDGRPEDHYLNGVMRGPIMRYWCDLYLIHTGRIFSMMMASPWGKEWLEAVKPMMAWGFEKSGLGEVIGGLESYRQTSDGMVPRRTLGEAIADDREGLTEREAIERAMRGPQVPDLGESAS